MAASTPLGSRWIHELTWPQVNEYLSHDDVVLVPIGATEQHGPHAPIMLDTGWAITCCEEAAALSECLIAPPMHYGWSYGHMGYPGTIGITGETLSRVAYEIGDCLVHQGFRRIIFVNGNRLTNLPPMEMAAVRLNMDTGAFAAVVDCGLIAREEVAALCDGPPGTLGHAGESETAMVLAKFPHLVNMALAPPNRNDVHPSAAFREVHNSIDPRVDGNAWFTVRDPEEFRHRTEPRGGVVGDARLATAEKGHAMVKAIATALAKAIDIARARKADVRVPPVRG